MRSPAVKALLRQQAQRARDYYPVRRRRCRGANAAGSSPRRSWGPFIARCCDRIEREDYDVFSRVVRVPRPRRAAIAAATWAKTCCSRDVPGRHGRSAADLPGLSAASALAARGAARAGRRCPAAARRPRDGVPRPSHRRARRQRPARAVRLLSRDAGVSAPGRARKIGSARRTRSSWSATTARGQRSVLRCPSLPAPLHLLAGVLKWQPIPLARQAERAASRPADSRGAALSCRRHRRCPSSRPG